MWFGVLDLYVFTHDESSFFVDLTIATVLDLYVFTHDESPCPASQAGGQVFDIDYNIPKALVIEDIDELLKANTENND